MSILSRDPMIRQSSCEILSHNLCSFRWMDTPTTCRLSCTSVRFSFPSRKTVRVWPIVVVTDKYDEETDVVVVNSDVWQVNTPCCITTRDARGVWQQPLLLVVVVLPPRLWPWASMRVPSGCHSTPNKEGLRQRQPVPIIKFRGNVRHGRANPKGKTNVLCCEACHYLRHQGFVRDFINSPARPVRVCNSSTFSLVD